MCLDLVQFASSEPILHIQRTMSRRLDITPQRRDKLSPSEMRDLIEEYKIVFRGPLIPSEWPPHLRKLFGGVRRAATAEYDKYTPNSAEKTPFVVKLKRRADKLVETAHLDRKYRVNEPTLRGSTEHLVFKRFEAEVKWCGYCRSLIGKPHARSHLT
jgi:hypothetical protein